MPGILIPMAVVTYLMAKQLDVGKITLAKRYEIANGGCPGGIVAGWWRLF